MANNIDYLFKIFGSVAFYAHEKKRRESIINEGLVKAIQIAQNQDWVSPHRIRNQLNLTQSDAQIILKAALEKGFLTQATNGRYYINPEAQYITTNPQEEELTEVKNSRSKKSMFSAILMWIIFISIIIALFTSSASKKTASVEANQSTASPDTKTVPVTHKHNKKIK